MREVIGSMVTEFTGSNEILLSGDGLKQTRFLEVRTLERSKHSIKKGHFFKEF